MTKLTYPEANKRLRRLISTIDTRFQSSPNSWRDHPHHGGRPRDGGMMRVLEVEDPEFSLTPGHPHE